MESVEARQKLLLERSDTGKPISCPKAGLRAEGNSSPQAGDLLRPGAFAADAS